MGIVAVWTQPIATAIDFTRTAFRTATETGDLTYACYSISQAVANLLLRNDPLDAVWRESEMALEFARRARFHADVIVSQQRFIAAMFGFIYFALLDTHSPVWIFVAIALSLLPGANMYGPQAALIAESFAPRLRYSGAGLGYHLASVIAGGPAPFIATALFAAYHSGYAIAFYILGCGVISIVATALLKDYTNKDIYEEYDRVLSTRSKVT